ncbi:MAG TPA: cytochrome c oxidase subunit II, partial [Longimicrobiales bacterium]|nr:cytochrome c oxidase subunit II [Longimicrobiales bacterium]
MAFSRKDASLASLTTGLLLLLAACGDASKYPQTTFEPVSEVGRLLNHLFWNTTWWTIGIMILVEVLIVVIIFKFREKPDSPEPKHIHGHTGLEIAWTIIPSLIVLVILVPTVSGIFKTQATPPKDALVVEVIGHQWWWEFRYPEYGVITANELVLPTGRNVDLQVHSADVIHSFWVPRVSGKRDVNPQPRTVAAERARVNHIQFNIEQAGYYAGQCAEYCGDSHGLMRTAILAMTPEDFTVWASSMEGGMPKTVVSQNAPMGAGTADKVPLGVNAAANTKEGGSLGAPPDTLKGPAFEDQQKTTVSAPAERTAVSPTAPTGAPAPGRGTYQDAGPGVPGDNTALVEEGKKLFTSRACVACHTIKGTTAQGKIGPNLTRFGMRRGVGALIAKSTQENVEKWIHRPRDMKPGALMPGANEGAGGMPATGLKDEEIKAIAA